jgi:hypothetical protein
MTRKERAEAWLRQLGIPVNEALPPLEADEDVLLRDPVEVARRAAALWVVAARGEGMPAARALEILADAGALDALTPRERRFLDDPAPTPGELADAVWNYESLWVLLWALGHLPAADRLDRRCDVGAVIRIMVAHGVNDLAAGPARSVAEVLDLADFLHRCHWAVNQAVAKKGAMPAALDPGVVFQRNRALHWLTRHRGLEWDDIRPEA